jgi:hypothetical protein
MTNKELFFDEVFWERPDGMMKAVVGILLEINKQLTTTTKGKRNDG